MCSRPGSPAGGLLQHQMGSASPVAATAVWADPARRGGDPQLCLCSLARW